MSRPLLAGETAHAETLLSGLKSWAELTPEVMAVWLTGSFGAGTADRFSDLDLRMVIDRPRETVLDAVAVCGRRKARLQGERPPKEGFMSEFRGDQDAAWEKAPSVRDLHDIDTTPG